MVSLALPDIGARLNGARVEILGVFGAGKTTLATDVSGGEFPTLLERHHDNPFWGRAEIAAAIGILPYDLSFLLHHVELAAGSALTHDKQVSICDWSLATDRLWASLRLGSDLALYTALHRRLVELVGPPIGYLYLKHPANVIVERLIERNRKEELSLVGHIQNATLELERLAQSLDQSFVMVVDDAIAIADIRKRVYRWATITQLV